ncbi:MAG: helix-turn-helix domain-containing protein [Phycisphaeraceae bacterium JB051]
MPSKRLSPTDTIARMLQVHSVGHFSDQPDHLASRSKATDYLIIWVVGGKGFAKTRSTRVEAAAGHLLNFRPHKRHAYGSSAQQPWDIHWVHFGGQRASEYMDAITEYGELQAFLGHDESLLTQFEDLQAAAMGLEHAHRDTPKNLDILTGQMLAGLLGRIIHLLRQRATERHIESTDQLNITAVRKYIHQHLTENITLEMLAQAHHLSVTHFSRLFRKHFGSSPMHYMIQQRMTRAATLLTQTLCPIRLVAQAVGYEDAYYFSRLFKRVIGMSPRDYRRANSHDA